MGNVENSFIPLYPLWLLGCLGFMAYQQLSYLVGYLGPNQFLNKLFLFQTIQFSMSSQFYRQKHFYFKLFSLVKQF